MSLKNLLLGPGSAYTAYDGKTPKINPLATKQSTMHAVNNAAGYSISGDYAAITNNDYAPTAVSSTQPIADPIFSGYRESDNHRNSVANTREITFSESSSVAMKIAKGVGVPLLIIAVIAGGLKFGGIGATVPTVGSKSFFGASTNSIVFYKKTTSVKAGTPVVAKDNETVLFGNYGGDVGNLSLFTINGSQFSVPKESISGRGILLIPYIGSLLKPILS
jgi:hypothetical protein